jgi:hypothetical protein
VSRSENNYFAFIRVLHTNNQSFFSTSDTKMAWLASAPKNTSLQNLPDNEKNTIGLAMATRQPKRDCCGCSTSLFHHQRRFCTKGMATKEKERWEGCLGRRRRRA